MPTFMNRTDQLIQRAHNLFSKHDRLSFVFLIDPGTLSLTHSA